MKREHKMVKCTDCGKEILEDHIAYCDMCGAPLCEECGTTGLCSMCAELWESEIDLEAMEAAAKHHKAQFRLTSNSTYDPVDPREQHCSSLE